MNKKKIVDLNEDNDHPEIEKVEGIFLLGFLVLLSLGLGLYFVNFPGMGPIRLPINILGLLVMSVLPGLICSQALLWRQEDCESPKWDLCQSIAEKSLIFFGIGSVSAIWLSFSKGTWISAGLTASLLITAILIYAGWFFGNRWRKKNILHPD